MPFVTDMGPVVWNKISWPVRVRTLRSIYHAQLLEDPHPSLQEGILRFELSEALFKGATLGFGMSQTPVRGFYELLSPLVVARRRDADFTAEFCYRAMLEPSFQHQLHLASSRPFDISSRMTYNLALDVPSVAMIGELVLIVLLIIVAGRFAVQLLSGPYALTFWDGTVAPGILVPLALNWYARRPGLARGNLVMVVAVLALFGGALLRISLVQAGQA
jgi:hypothetical protein